jgi:Domain of unknown function (DUF4383)
MTTNPGGEGRRANWATVQRAAFVTGLAFLTLGVLGFIPGITTGYHAMSWFNHHPGAAIGGLFEVSVLHNIVHLASGVAGVVLARTLKGARLFLVCGGLFYLAVCVYGVVIIAVAPESKANFLPVNIGDNWLHLGIGGCMLALGWLLTRNRKNAHRVGITGTA